VKKKSGRPQNTVDEVDEVLSLPANSERTSSAPAAMVDATRVAQAEENEVA
jgi:hypothetical protein